MTTADNGIVTMKSLREPVFCIAFCMHRMKEKRDENYYVTTNLSKSFCAQNSLQQEWGNFPFAN